MLYPPTPWIYPSERYYYGWYDTVPETPSDGEIKSMLVDRLRKDEATKNDDITVDVKKSVVVLSGEVSAPLVKRVAGDDAWDTPGVVDVSNQLQVVAR